MRKLLWFLPLAFVTLAFAQTTTTYTATSGYVGPSNAVTGYFTGGGSFVSPNTMGAGCYYGGCSNWTFSNYPLSYALSDGTTASFSNFAGSANFTTQNVPVSGTASGVDSQGRSVNVDISWEWAARCKSGRGGGCTKKLITATMTVTTAP